MRSTMVLLVFLAASVAAFGSWQSTLHARRSQSRDDRDRSVAETVAPTPAATSYFGIALAGESAAIEPYVAGRVKRVFVKPGDTVAKGDRIALLDSRSLEQDLAGARAVYAGAASRLQRRLALAKQPASSISAVTADELDVARFEAAKDLAMVSALARSLADTRVIAPFTGTVAEQYLYAGAVAGPGHPIVRIIGQGQPRVRFALPDDEAPKLAVGMVVRIELGSPPLRIPATVS
jgi:RND family efflux transporter MFP subunit